VDSREIGPYNGRWTELTQDRIQYRNFCTDVFYYQKSYPCA